MERPKNYDIDDWMMYSDWLESQLKAERESVNELSLHCQDLKSSLAEKEQEYQSFVGHHEAQTKDWEIKLAEKYKEIEDPNICLSKAFADGGSKERLREVLKELFDEYTEAINNRSYNAEDAYELIEKVRQALKEGD